MTAQRCIHKAGLYWTLTVDGLLMELCADCYREIENRTTTETRDETPIELLAKGEPMPPVKCSYSTHDPNPGRLQPSKPPCNMMAAPGETMCPRHVFLSKHEKEEAAKREEAKRKRHAERARLMKPGYRR